MFTLSVTYVQYTLGTGINLLYSLNLEVIQEFPIIISKRHTSKLTLQAIFNYCKKICSCVSILCLDRNRSLVQVHIYRAYTVILALQFLYMPRYT